MPANPTTVPPSLDALLDQVVQAFRRAAPEGWEAQPRAALALPTGEVVAATEAGATCSLTATLAASRAQCGESWPDGNVVVTNDVYSGATHPSEFTAIRQGSGGAWLMMRANFADLGGWTYGGYTTRALDIWSESVRIVPTRLFIGGQPRREIFEILRLNSRAPFLAQGCATAFGQALQVFDDLLAQRNSGIPAGSIAGEWPEGTRTGRARGAAAWRDEPIAITTELEFRRNRVRVRFPDPPPSRQYSVNMTAPMTADAVLRGLGEGLGYPRADWPALAGRIDLDLPPDTLLSVRRHLPVGHGRAVTGSIVTSAISDALGRSIALAPEAGFDAKTGEMAAEQRASLKQAELRAKERA